jgi:hypothetical protein
VRCDPDTMFSLSMSPPEGRSRQVDAAAGTIWTGLGDLLRARRPLIEEAGRVGGAAAARSS